MLPQLVLSTPSRTRTGLCLARRGSNVAASLVPSSHCSPAVTIVLPHAVGVQFESHRRRPRGCRVDAWHPPPDTVSTDERRLRLALDEQPSPEDVAVVTLLSGIEGPSPSEVATRSMTSSRTHALDPLSSYLDRRHRCSDQVRNEDRIRVSSRGG